MDYKGHIRSIRREQASLRLYMENKDNTNDSSISVSTEEDMLSLLKDVKRPYVFYSKVVSDDLVLYGDTIDRIIKLNVPSFNPSRYKGFMVSEKWKAVLSDSTILGGNYDS